MANRWGKTGNSDRLNFLGLQNHCGRWLQSRNWKTLAPWRKSYDKPQSAYLKTETSLCWQTCVVKAMFFLVLMYGCESWTIKKAKHQRTDAFKLWCWRRLLRIPWTMRRSHQSILKEINPEYTLEGLMLKLKLEYFCKVISHLIHTEREGITLWKS